MKDLWIKTESMIFKADRVGYDKLNDDTYGIICFTGLRDGHYHEGFSFAKFKTENECKGFLNHISDFLMSDEVVFNAEYVLQRWFYEPPHEEKCFKLVNHALNDFVVFNSTSKSLHTNCKLIMVARNWNFEDCSWHEDK